MQNNKCKGKPVIGNPFNPNENFYKKEYIECEYCNESIIFGEVELETECCGFDITQCKKLKENLTKPKSRINKHRHKLCETCFRNSDRKNNVNVQKGILMSKKRLRY